MKKNRLKIIITIVVGVIILIMYVIYNISIRNVKKVDNISKGSNKEKVTANNLRIGIINFDTMNPILSNNTNIQNVSRLIFDSLFDLTNDFKLESDLATEWTSLDNNTYLIKLRENVKWHDGNNFDSDDVIFTIEYLQRNGKESIYYANIKNIKEIIKIDDLMIKIITKQEEPYFEYNLIFPILSSKYFNNDNIQLEERNKAPIGTGMYYISEVQYDNITLKRNGNWWQNKENNLDTIQLNLYKNLNNALSELNSSNIDIIMSSSPNIDEYLKGMQVKHFKYIGRNYDYLALNCENSLLKNKEIRQAISYAINKSNIINEVYNNRYKESNFPLDFGSYLYGENVQKIGSNLEKAQDILNKSNWKKENDIWQKEIDGINKRIRLSLLVDSKNDNRIKVAQNIKTQLEEFGIEINVLKRDQKQYEEDIKKKNYDILLTGNTYSYSPSLYSFFCEDNLANYKSQTIDKNIKNLKLEDNESEKRRILNEIIKEYNSEVPYISLYYDTYTLIYSNNLKANIKPNSYNIFYNIEEWYREYDK